MILHELELTGVKPKYNKELPPIGEDYSSAVTPDVTNG